MWGKFVARGSSDDSDVFTTAGRDPWKDRTSRKNSPFLEAITISLIFHVSF
jgi:hypothetical protein